MLPTLRVTCVSVSAAPVFIYLLRPSQPYYIKDHQQMSLFCNISLLYVSTLHVSGLYQPIIRGIPSCCYLKDARYEKPKLLNLFCPFWEMFCERQDNTVIHASHMGKYMLHAQESETLQTFTFRLLKGKQRTSVTFQTDGNIPISLHVFAFLLIVDQDTVFIHDAAFFFFLHVCAFA